MTILQPPPASAEGDAVPAFDHAAEIVACARGDRGALRRLYDREAAQLLGVAFRIVRRPDLADEVVHDAFVQIWRKAGSYDRNRGDGRGWIYSIVRHRALNLLRQDARLSRLEPEQLDTLADEGSEDPLRALARLSDEDALRGCLQRLDEPRRRMILLAFIEGCTHVQIAERLRQPLGTVKSWIRRSLLTLKECLA